MHRVAPAKLVTHLGTALVAASLAAAAPAGAAEITRCDTLASHQFDPGNVAPGVGFAALDAPKAIAACTEALKADENNPRLRFELGRALERGGNYGEAAKAYRRAADSGYVAAQTALGGLYQNGLGVTADVNEAIAWYRKAAEQGYAVAEDNLGMAYREGRGVPQDEAQAVAWFKKAAAQFYQPAALHLIQGAKPATPTVPAAAPVPAAPASPTPSPPTQPAATTPPSGVTPEQPAVTTPAQAKPPVAPAAPATLPVKPKALPPAPTPAFGPPVVPAQATPQPQPSPAPTPAAQPALVVPAQPVLQQASTPALVVPAQAPPQPETPPPPTPVVPAAAKPAATPASPAPPPSRPTQAALPADPEFSSKIGVALTQCLLPAAGQANRATIDDAQAADLLIAKCQRPWVAWISECIGHGETQESCIKKSTLFARTTIEQQSAQTAQ